MATTELTLTSHITHKISNTAANVARVVVVVVVWPTLKNLCGRILVVVGVIKVVVASGWPNMVMMGVKNLWALFKLFKNMTTMMIENSFVSNQRDRKHRHTIKM